MRLNHPNKEAQARPTNAERLLRALADGKWHATSELVRRVGHTFGRAKFALVATGYRFEKRRHASEPYQWQYRLLDRPDQ